MNFNGPQIHLMLNHLPVVGFILLTPVLALTAWRGDDRLKRLALLGTIAISLLVLPAFWTGEPAEDGIEHLPGVSKHLIHEHEEAAEKALTLGLITGGIALVGYILSRKKNTALKIAINSALVGSIVTSLAMAKTAHEGGKIRHPEIRDSQAQGAESESGSEISKDAAGERAEDRDHDGDND